MSQVKTYTRKRDAARGAERLAKKYPFITQYSGSTFNGDGYVACVTVNIKPESVPPTLLKSAIINFQDDVTSTEHVLVQEIGEVHPTIEQIKQVAEEEIKQVAHVAAEEVKQVAQVAEEKITNLVSIPDRREGVVDRRKTPRYPVDFQVETVEMKQDKETGKIEEVPGTQTKHEFKGYIPGPNTMSRQIWDLLDNYLKEKKHVPSPKEAKEEIFKGQKFHHRTEMIQYYNWRAFNGFKSTESKKTRR